ncbi:MAG: hypothetical protein C5B51_10010 [Terriglobia bacterium]|nr:MAG: hypothetical protein C5B51_10010 [Terriglobia bacterium]
MWWRRRFRLRIGTSEAVFQQAYGLILGEGETGRLLALIFTRRGDKLRPISCRPMRIDERRLYETSIQEHS